MKTETHGKKAKCLLGAVGRRRANLWSHWRDETTSCVHICRPLWLLIPGNSMNQRVSQRKGCLVHTDLPCGFKTVNFSSLQNTAHIVGTKPAEKKFFWGFSMLPFTRFALFCYTFSIIIFMTDVKQLYSDMAFSHIAQHYFYHHFCDDTLVQVCTCVGRHLEAYTRPWMSAPPASVSWKASVRPSSFPHVGPAQPALPLCAHLGERESDRGREGEIYVIFH